MAQTGLRPLGFGEILDAAFTLYRRNFATLFFTALIVTVPLTLLAGVVESAGLAAGSGGQIGASFAMMVPSLLLILLGTMILWAALTWQTASVYEGGKPSVREGYRHAARALLPIMGAGLLAMGAIIPVSLLLAFVVGFASLAVDVEIAAAVLMGAMVLMMFVLMASLFAVLHAIILERRGPLAAIKRSWSLSKGARLRIVGILLVSLVITLLPVFGIGAVAGLGTSMWDVAESMTLSPVQMFFQQLISMLSSALTTPFMVACVTVLYFDRRVRTEAYDLEVAADELLAS
jgi:hypothetical protein